VELHRTAGFKFRTQHEMLARFVVFAEQHGDGACRSGPRVGRTRTLRSPTVQTA
jgi:hypothetical protein